MIQTSLWPLQQAIFQRLSNDAAVMTIATGVHDAVEDGLVHPYITIGAPTTDPFATKNTFNEEVSVVIHAWSTYSGKKEAQEMLNTIMQAIGNGLSIEGPFKLLSVSYPSLQVIDDIDPRIKHGLASFTFTIKNI